uniref:glucuronosyltransferase n=1 Tax=Strongyloides papillosus TaxID=174720 RepID=A0A0N5BMT0_STREA
MLKFYISLFLCIVFYCYGDCYKILVYNPLFVSSHSTFMVKIANLLSEAGHDVTILQVMMNPKIDDSGVKGPKIVKPSNRNPDIESKSNLLKGLDEESWSGKHDNPLKMVNQNKELLSWITSACEHTIRDPKLTVKMREENFDLAIIEIFVPCGLGVAKYYNVRNTVTVSSGPYFDSTFAALGLTVPVSQLSTSFAPLPQKMNILERVFNFVTYLGIKTIFNHGISVGNDIFERIYPEGQIDLDKLFAETAYYIVNSDPLTNYGMPSTPKFLQLGGFLSPNSKPLSGEFNEILNRRKKNVLVSFGSIAKSTKMTDNMRNNLARLFKEHPDVTFIWKYEEDRPEIFKGIKLGRYISKFDFDGNYDKLKEVFDDLMNNKIYSETAKRTSLMIANRPYNPRDLFIKYIEFAAQFGRIDHFTIPNSDLPLWKYLYLDFISLLIGVILMVVFIVKKTINVVKKSICKGKKNHKTD